MAAVFVPPKATPSLTRPVTQLPSLSGDSLHPPFAICANNFFNILSLPAALPGLSHKIMKNHIDLKFFFILQGWKDGGKVPEDREKMGLRWCLKLPQMLGEWLEWTVTIDWLF